MLKSEVKNIDFCFVFVPQAVEGEFFLLFVWSSLSLIPQRPEICGSD
jgi:hypothetical protein